MGKTIRSYNGDGFKKIKTTKTKKSQKGKKIRNFGFYDEDDNHQSNDDSLTNS